MRSIKLKGSTIVEVIVASVVFMVIFAISLETITRLTINRKDDTIYVIVQNEIDRCFMQYAGTERLPSTTVREYDWGRIEITCGGYKNYHNLQLLDVSAYITTERKKLTKRQIIEFADE